MNSEIQPEFSVSEAVAIFNQIFETATPTITINGEIANFKINQNKWVFFDIKDEDTSINCFMSVFNLRIAIEDGMRVRIVARPGITKWGKFSLMIQSITPVGEGSIRRAFELLRAKLYKEGLFSTERKRALPELPSHIGVISSIDAAGYVDFIKILNQRFSDLRIDVANVQVQGIAAPNQIIEAIKYFNEMSAPPGVIAIVRGGGSRDDLIAFDDEILVREIAGSRVPIITGIGHEIDTTLADLAADVRASTPSNAAQILTPDKLEIISGLNMQLRNLILKSERKFSDMIYETKEKTNYFARKLNGAIEDLEVQYKYLNATLKQLDPKIILKRGFAVVRDENNQLLASTVKIGEILTIENDKLIIETEVRNVKAK